MSGDPQATSARLSIPAALPRWSEWISLERGEQRRSRREQLEVIARLFSEERSAERRGEFSPSISREWAPR